MCRFHVVADTGSAPCQRQWHQPSERLSSSYWSIQPWFHTEGKLAAVLIITFLLGSPNTPRSPSRASRISGTVAGEFQSHHHQEASRQLPASIKNFWRHCRGGISFLQGESLTLNLFTLFFLFCLVYFILSCLLLYIQNKKNSFLYSRYFCFPAFILLE